MATADWTSTSCRADAGKLHKVQCMQQIAAQLCFVTINIFALHDRVAPVHDCQHL